MLSPKFSDHLLADIIGAVHNRSVFDLFDYLVDDEQRHKEPFAGDDGVAEAVFDFDVQLGGFEKSVE